MGRWCCAGPPPAWRSPPANSAESKATENSQFSLRNLLELPTISLSKVVRLLSQVAGSPPKFHGDWDILPNLADEDCGEGRGIGCGGTDGELPGSNWQGSVSDEVPGTEPPDVELLRAAVLARSDHSGLLHRHLSSRCVDEAQMDLVVARTAGVDERGDRS